MRCGEEERGGVGFFLVVWVIWALFIESLEMIKVEVRLGKRRISCFVSRR